MFETAGFPKLKRQLPLIDVFGFCSKGRAANKRVKDLLPSAVVASRTSCPVRAAV